jgi:hypothetical protein
VAESVTLSIAFDAVDAMAIFPAPTPADVGENVSLKVVLCPAANVTGKLIPVKAKPLPLGVTWEIVTLDPPEFVTV